VLIASSAADALVNTHQEVTDVCAHFPCCTAFVDKPGGLDHLASLTSPPYFLHISAHSIIRHDAQIFSGLQLTNEVLAVEQCYELPLGGTELVTLSGCTTASGMDSGGALLAFQTAFFVAGAKRVLSSLWPVADDASAVWMRHFYHNWSDGQSIAQAVQQTQQQLHRQPGYRHPALWAAFACARR